MWTKEQRAIYWRDEDRYPSNLTVAEWERLKPLIPEALPGGRPRKTDMRAAMNAIFYLLRTGCPCYDVGTKFKGRKIGEPPVASRASTYVQRQKAVTAGSHWHCRD
jgi:transposase